MFSFKGRTLIELNAAFEVWLNRVYHQRKHSATGQTPFARFTDNMQCLRPAPDNLTRHFRQRVRRKVAKDRTLTLNGQLFEAPVALIGHQVELLYHNHCPDQVEIVFKQRSYGMARPVQLHVNCRVKRDKNHHTQIVSNVPVQQYRGGNLFGKE